MPDPVEFNIEDVVALDPADTAAFTPEHKTFLESHKDELTTDELAKFGFEANPPKPPAPPPPPPDPKPKKEGEADEPDEEGEKISKEVSKQLNPIVKQNRELQAKVDIDSFIATNPDFGKYRASIAEFKNHPNYANVPVHEIAKMVAADDLMKIGARKEREAARTAANTQTRTSSARPSGTQKNWGTASKEDFEAKRREVLGQN